jgi:hypothetical protein
VTPGAPRLSARLRSWLLEGLSTRTDQPPGPHTQPSERHQHPWWKVRCLTGVDYFSTLGYQPGIAALAAGVLSPVATILLVLLTLFGALPIYRRVAAESPHGEGSIAMLERLLSWWQGKLFVLVLLGFVATDFIITITLSAADATAHVLENPLVPGVLEGHQVGVTLFLIALLGGVFLKGFTEAIGIAVRLVATYLALNLVVVSVALEHLVANPQLVVDWRQLLTTSYSSPLAMVAVALVVFPKLALGLSGFETGLQVTGEERHGYRILRMESSAVPNAIATVLLHIRDRTGECPHIYFDWTEGNPVAHLVRFLIFGSGEVAPVTREVLREAEPDPQQRPSVHVA